MVAWVLFTSACATPSADTVLFNGKIFTADPAHPWAEALIIRGERVIAVGSVTEIQRQAPESARRIDLAGRVVIPGLNDARLELSDATTASVRVLGADAVSQGVTSLQVFSVTPVADTVRAFREADLPLRVRVLRMPTPNATGENRDSRPYLSAAAHRPPRCSRDGIRAARARRRPAAPGGRLGVRQRRPDCHCDR